MGLLFFSSLPSLFHCVPCLLDCNDEGNTVNPYLLLMFLEAALGAFLDKEWGKKML